MVTSTKLIYFNVETTGWQWHDQIIYLSAYNNEYEFHKYMVPEVPIQMQGSGFKVVDGKLLENGRSIQTRNRKQVIRDFLIYCEGTLSPTQGSPKGSPAGQVPGQVVLVAHNGKSLAFDKLLQEIDKAGLENEFGRIVKGFCDTLPVFRKLLRHRVIQMKSFKLVDLHKDLMNKKHHKCDNQKAMMTYEICSKYKTNLEAREITRWYPIYTQYLRNKSKVMFRESFRDIFGGIPELQIVTYRLAESCMSLDYLMDVYKKGGKKALRKELSEESPQYGYPPVITDSKIIKIIVDKIAQHCNELLR